jgi:Holliday junction resolvase RusA-like endonuclease
MDAIGLKKCLKTKEDCNNKYHGDNLNPCNRVQVVSKKYVLHQEPKPLARPRFSEKRVYDSQQKLKLLMGVELLGQHENLPPFEGILHFDIDFYFPYPITKQTKERLEKQRFHVFRPDLSNLIKMIEDVCVDARIIKDDCFISSIFSRKLYDTVARTEFIITQLSNKDK